MNGAARGPTGEGERGPGCITCGDVAVRMRVLAVDATGETARCVDAGGRRETVATALVAAVAPGDALLVHAGVALHHDPGTAPVPVRGGA